MCADSFMIAASSENQEPRHCELSVSRDCFISEMRCSLRPRSAVVLDGEVVLHHGATDVATFDLSEILRAADVCLIAEPVFIPTARCMLALASAQQAHQLG